jgi:hypothetical protein
MNAQRLSQAEETVAFLLQAERSGSPVPIPGAFERRAADRARLLDDRTDVPVTNDARAAAGSDREHLEHERDGGGAPSERAPRRSGTIGARLWHSVLHPTRVPDIWRRSLPEAQ